MAASSVVPGSLAMQEKEVRRPGRAAAPAHFTIFMSVARSQSSPRACQSTRLEVP